MSSKVAEESVKEYLLLGEEAAKSGKLNQAVEYYQKILSIQPESDKARLYLGDIYRSQGKINEAIDCYTKTPTSKGFVLPYLRLRQLLDSPDLSLDQVKKINEFSLNETKKLPQNKPVQAVVINSFALLDQKLEAIKFCEEITYSSNLRVAPDFVKKYWHLQENERKPNFIIIGFMKCGTTSLYDYIVQHPKVLPANQKEIMFFSDQKLLSLGLDWYRSNFPPIPQGSGYLTGEASTLYAFNFATAEQLWKSFPETKLIVILRNPVDRAISHYYFNKKIRGLNQDLEKVITSEITSLQNLKDISREIDNKKGFISAGLYTYFLEKWMSIFPREQFLILKMEELAEDTEAVLNKTFNFLELPGHKIPQPTKKNSGSYDVVDDKLRQRMSEFFQVHNQRLENFLGMKFGWE